MVSLALVGSGFFIALSGQTRPNFSAQLDQTRVPVGARAVLTVSLEGENIEVGRGVQLPELSPYFQMEGQMGPSSRTEMSIINGRMTKRTSWQMQYVLIAVKSGQFTIPRMAFSSGNQVYYTSPISVEITEAKTAAPAGPAESKGFSPPEDPYLKLELDQGEYYPGEQIRVSWYLYYQEPFVNLSLGMSPVLADFNAMELETAAQLSPAQKNFGGRNWNVSFVRSLALFPLRAGKPAIGSMELRFQRSSGRRDFFGMPLVQEYSVRAEPVSVIVQPLPAGAPAGFTGAVGTFSVYSHLSKTETRTGENLNLEIEIQGDGNPDYILEPKLEFPPAFEIYPPEIKLEKEVEAGRLQSHKRFNYVAVAREAGEFKIPEVSFSYFDPGAKEYRLAQSEPILVKVTPGPGLAGTASLSPSSPEIKADIRFIKSGQKELPDQSPGIFGKGWFWLSHLAGIFLVAAAFWYRVYQARLESDPGFARKQRALGQFKKQAKRAKNFTRAKDYLQFSSELKKALLEYLGNRFNQSPWGLLEEEMVEVMKKEKIPEELIRELIHLLNDLSQAQYAGKIAPEPEPLLSRSEKWAQALEKAGK